MKTKKLLLGGLLKPVMRKMVASAQKAKMKKTPEIAKEEFESIKAARDVVQKQGITLEGKKIDTDFLSEKDAIFKDMGTILAKGKKAAFYQTYADKISKADKVSKSTKEGAKEIIDDLEAYKNTQAEKMGAMLSKDINKPTLQNKGGLIKGKPKLALRGWK
jgi:hypothetical protein